MANWQAPTFKNDYIVIAGVKHKMQVTKHSHYIVELFGTRTVVCKDGWEVIALKDSLEGH